MLFKVLPTQPIPWLHDSKIIEVQYKIKAMWQNVVSSFQLVLIEVVLSVSYPSKGLALRCEGF